MAWHKRIDTNQKDIVLKLRQLGFSVQTGHDDILVGANGKTFWFEIKKLTATGKVHYAKKGNATQKRQEMLRDTWRGHYQIVGGLEEILKAIEE